MYSGVTPAYRVVLTHYIGSPKGWTGLGTSDAPGSFNNKHGIAAGDADCSPAVPEPVRTILLMYEVGLLYE